MSEGKVQSTTNLITELITGKKECNALVPFSTNSRLQSIINKLNPHCRSVCPLTLELSLYKIIWYWILRVGKFFVRDLELINLHFFEFCRADDLYHTFTLNSLLVINYSTIQFHTVTPVLD